MLNLFGNSYIVISIAVGIAIFMMILTNTTHPPAGADPILVITTSVSWNFLFANIVIGTLLLFIIAFVYHNIKGILKFLIAVSIPHVFYSLYTYFYSYRSYRQHSF